MRILVVDDDPFICRLLVRQLKTLGCEQVTDFNRALAAVEHLERDPGGIDLIFCDLQMPEMDGIEFIRHLVRLGYAGSLVLISGEDERILQSAERLAREHKLRVPGALFKPVSSAQLQQLLEQAAPCASAPQAAEARRYDAEELAHAIGVGELVNHYQPKIDFASGQCSGVEALVRWQHPRDGLVYPDRFIAQAEEAGLIDALMCEVLRNALRDARHWRKQGLELQMAVNVSMDNLQGLDFPDLVERAALDSGVPLSSLVLEVTESHLMKNRQAALDILTRLRLKRIHLSIDDFGTGHSSLVQLRDIPFNELKIDRSFVHGAWRDASLSTILNASLEMARKLGMKAVAEGIEDRADWDYLRQAGCDVAQGWFIARAMPAEQLPAWLQDWERRRAELITPICDG
ncbi:EAL domain, c-di-GMP-specific phosphodiesterase class I (or its enzymatically inactive variant) [Pseudomonas linyingensis]|uniref:EAL domain, c-di-GMP-specific phosphodiesterase class I (Or its enzymatically inactive variant) n=1 Tax=Pseudomonas linyingensis TaxID=915471 RepID=A0A1H7ABW3_9PSED|nr:EAL domain-containing response regulator [Pseudomonas linyingensis]SEJ59572.1 EAL domain, c-di-GMP-specific phosphodiesterase class I (or its enzymatically inactive variant) [Pseudomonas linyingensis]